MCSPAGFMYSTIIACIAHHASQTYQWENTMVRASDGPKENLLRHTYEGLRLDGRHASSYEGLQFLCVIFGREFVRET